jgi:hypothetical protein
MTMVAALFVATAGVYFGLPDVDPWDQKRDARLYTGPYPVVAHPPCERWCQLARLNEHRYGHRVGDDGGCFASALNNVRRVGGVLEHPAETIAWRSFGLMRPMLGLWSRDLVDGAWVTEVHQSAYGHRARKRTWLLYVGDVAPPALDWSSPAPTAKVSFFDDTGCALPGLSKKEAKATPLPFRDLLLSIARSAYSKREAA